jgi:hypothetical protein
LTKVKIASRSRHTPNSLRGVDRAVDCSLAPTALPGHHCCVNLKQANTLVAAPTRQASFRHGSAAIPYLAAGPPKKAPINRWEHRYLGEERFPERLSPLEIEHFFTFDEDELASIRERRGPLNRLALALQVGFLKMTGGTLNSVELIPPAILDHLGRQLDCVPPRIASLRAFYRRRRRTLFEHHVSALRLAERGLVAYLRREAAAVFDHAELIARARSWLVEHPWARCCLRDARFTRRLTQRVAH